MRRIIILAVLACACIGFTPAAADAANCTGYGQYPTYWTGYLQFDSYVNGCTGVDMIEFKRSLTTGACNPVHTVGNGCESGWYDISESSRGINGNHPAPAGLNPDSTVVAVFPTTYTYWQTWRVNAWCGGGTHTVETEFLYRIHNASGGGSWGPYHVVIRNPYAIWC